MNKLIKNQEIVLVDKLWSWYLIDEKIKYAEFIDDNLKFFYVPKDSKIVILDIIQEDLESNTIKFLYNDSKVGYTAISNLNEVMNINFDNNF